MVTLYIPQRLRRRRKHYQRQCTTYPHDTQYAGHSTVADLCVSPGIFRYYTIALSFPQVTVLNQKYLWRNLESQLACTTRVIRVQCKVIGTDGSTSTTSYLVRRKFKQVVQYVKNAGKALDLWYRAGVGSTERVCQRAVYIRLGRAGIRACLHVISQ